MTPQSLVSPSLGADAIAPKINQIHEIDYPDSDGNPMSDNTEQYRWIVIIKENLEIMYADNPNVFVAGDLAWYPVRYTQQRMAPDVMVVFGRPKGRRGSYKQWEEDNIAPQVAFEILSPSNKDRRGIDSLDEKFAFYKTYGIQEYYIYDPDDFVLQGWEYAEERFVRIEMQPQWVSPLLQVRFEWQVGKELVLYRPNGQRFLSSVELEQRALTAEQRAVTAEQRVVTAEQRVVTAEQRVVTAEQLALQERQLAAIAEQRAEQAERNAVHLANRLRALGIDPDDENV
jgi:Uma2 family endonuclease